MDLHNPPPPDRDVPSPCLSSGGGAAARMGALFAAFVLASGLLLLLWLPPMQMPDEMTHFFKADALSRGDFVARRLGIGNAGSDLPQSVSDFGWHYDLWIARSPQPYSVGALLGNGNAPLTGPMVPTGYPNTAIYPPVFYLPEAGVLAVARWLGLGTLAGYYLARIAVLLTSCALSACAIGLMPRGRLPMAMLLSLPMALALSVSCAQDAVQTGATALAVALLARWECRQGDRLLLMAALLLGMVIAARPAYAPLALLPLCLGAPSLRDRAGLVRRMIASVLALGIMVLSSVVFTRPAKVGFLLTQHVDARAQMAFVLRHPLHFVHVVAHTLRLLSGLYAREFLGVLGRLDIALPPGGYRILMVFLLLASVVAVGTARAPAGFGRAIFLRGGGILACVAVSGLAVFLALYVIWTPVGAPGIDGIQGRYFIPLAVVATLLFPLSTTAGGHRERAEFGLLGLYLLSSCVLTQWAVIVHFWRL